MRAFKSKKGLTFLTAMVVAVAAAVGGDAYFTATGSGTGSAGVGQASNIPRGGTITGPLSPAGDPAGVSVLVTNPGSGSQYVGDVHLASITSTTAGCDVSSSGANAAFTMADIPVQTTLTKS